MCILMKYSTQIDFVARYKKTGGNFISLDNTPNDRNTRIEILVQKLKINLSSES